MSRRRERLLAAVVVVMLGSGVAVDVVVDADWDRRGPAAARRLVASTSFCPPPPSRDSEVRIAVGGAPADGVRVRVGRGRPQSLSAGRMLVARRDGSRRRPAEVVGYEAAVEASAAAAIAGPTRGAAAVRCALTPGLDWFFPAGSSALGHDERLVVYNPFPDEAVVRVTLYTRTGTLTRSGLADVPVRARSFQSIRLNKYSPVTGVLAARVHAERGPVVAWRVLYGDPRGGPDGVDMSLGARSASDEWMFAEGAVGDGYDGRIVVLNPGDEEAVVTVALATERGLVQPPEFVDLAVPAGTAQPVPLGKGAAALPDGVTGVGAVVRSSNGVGVVAEREMTYATATASGRAAEVGAARAADRIVLGPAAAGADFDAIALLNPGTGRVRVAIRFERPEVGELTPTRLARLSLGPGERLKVPVTSDTGGAPLIAIVAATGPVVAERFAYSAAVRDVATVMGQPFRRIVP